MKAIITLIVSILSSSLFAVGNADLVPFGDALEHGTILVDSKAQCSATWVSEKHLITAAHCFKNSSFISKDDVDSLYDVTKISTIKNRHILFSNGTHPFENMSFKRLNVNVYLHPIYVINYNSPLFARPHDIAIIEVTKESQYSSQHLEVDYVRPKEGEEFTVTGYGKNKVDRRPAKRQGKIKFLIPNNEYDKGLWNYVFYQTYGYLKLISTFQIIKSLKGNKSVENLSVKASDQLEEISNFATLDSGDSGSALVNSKGKVTAIYVGKGVFANKNSYIQDIFKISLDMDMTIPIAERQSVSLADKRNKKFIEDILKK